MMEEDNNNKDVTTGDGKPLSERNGKNHKNAVSLDPKVCGVCGDKALGNNFNAITCESCKAFFRRNALRKKEFACPFNDECKVDPVTRRFCQKCRLKKCFDVGMKKEWIMTEEEKQLKKKKIEQNRLKRVASEPGMGGSEAKSPAMGTVHQHQILSSDSSTSSNDVGVFHNNNNSLPLHTPEHMMHNDNHRICGAAIDQIVAAANVLQAQEIGKERGRCWCGDNSENYVTEPPEPIEEHGHGLAIQDQQEPHPILASLVRPGVAESPPEVVPACASTGHYHYQHEYPSKKNMITQYNMEIQPEQFHPQESPPQHLQSQLQQPLPLNTMESILSVAISAEFNALGMLSDHPPTPSSQPSQHSLALNKAERAKLSELFFASEALNAPVDQDGPIKIETSDPSLINVINLTDIAIRRLIKMAKKIGAFKSMCQEDQIALLKGGCTEMMILRSVVSYDPERDSWNIPHSNGFNVKLGVLKEARGNLYEEHQRFVKSFKQEWRSDYNIMIILCAVTLFTPERPNVIHKDVVKLEQDSYYYLLKRYLESTRNGCEARSTYLQLIQRIAELHILNENHLRVFLEVNPREVEPLLIEIFDLKQ